MHDSPQIPHILSHFVTFSCESCSWEIHGASATTPFVLTPSGSCQTIWLVIAEVPRFPMSNFPSKMWQHVATCIVFVANCAHLNKLWQHVWGFVALLNNKCSSRHRLEASYRGHTERPQPQKLDLINSIKVNCSE